MFINLKMEGPKHETDVPLGGKEVGHSAVQASQSKNPSSTSIIADST